MSKIDEAVNAGRHPLTLAHLSMIDAAPTTLARAAAAAGFDGIGLRILAPRGTTLPGEVIGHPPTIREVKAILADTGLALLDAESFGLRAETDPARDYLAGLELVAELGGRAVLSSVIDQDRRRALDRYSRLCELAQPLGLVVGLEYISFRDVRTLREALAFIDAAGAPNGGVILDALHHSRVGGTPAEIAAMPAERLAYAQICDAGPSIPVSAEELLTEARTGRLLPGDGTLWLAEWLAALPPTLAIGLEAPVGNLAAVPPVERAKIMGARTRAFLAAAETAATEVQA